jgi:hypothetical protein
MIPILLVLIFMGMKFLPIPDGYLYHCAPIWLLNIYTLFTILDSSIVDSIMWQLGFNILVTLMMSSWGWDAYLI